MLTLHAILNAINPLLHEILNAINHLLHEILNAINLLLEILKLRSEPSLIVVYPIIHRVNHVSLTTTSSSMRVPRELI